MRLVWVAFPVPVEKAVITADNALAAGEGELGRVPVASEERRNIAAIPSLLLGGQHFPNLVGRIACAGLGLRHSGGWLSGKVQVARGQQCREESCGTGEFSAPGNGHGRVS